VDQPLQSLGTSAILQSDFPAAEKFYSRALAITEKVYGENSNMVAQSLLIMSRVYLAQKQFEKAEPIINSASCKTISR
jgi:hypothetical protein